MWSPPPHLSPPSHFGCAALATFGRDCPLHLADPCCGRCVHAPYVAVRTVRTHGLSYSALCATTLTVCSGTILAAALATKGFASVRGSELRADWVEYSRDNLLSAGLLAATPPAALPTTTVMPTTAVTAGDTPEVSLLRLIPYHIISSVHCADCAVCAVCCVTSVYSVLLECCGACVLSVCL